ncbi:hypothetical protein ACFPOI_23895 [Nonomuraea angiospora]|uniref:Uncharacterized protein n=1 Tax=Nonomuraea angiospora TaxID=46172 RepID=A0ABR9ML95_9ACTN|nr:hypothetical protein [Nonomuraea angiospora]MBE1593719.1 hypothetical protein [Nonomuraea angiospora]
MAIPELHLPQRQGEAAGGVVARPPGEHRRARLPPRRQPPPGHSGEGPESGIAVGDLVAELARAQGQRHRRRQPRPGRPRVHHLGGAEPA